MPSQPLASCTNCTKISAFKAHPSSLSRRFSTGSRRRETSPPEWELERGHEREREREREYGYEREHEREHERAREG